MEVRTSKGVVRGVNTGGVRQYLGIPYGKAERFEEAEEAVGWDGVLECDTVAPDAPQIPMKGTFRFPLRHGGRVSEDCLGVNVTVPRGGKKKYPVLVWVHGGAFCVGSGHNPTYDPVRFCETQQVVVVSLNYRLGVLGFFHHPDVPEIPPNLGLSDIVLALRWVQREIHCFNGDPTKITLCGESAGAMAVGMLLSTVETVCKGLFHAVILQSGTASPVSVRAATATAERYIKKLSNGKLSKSYLKTLTVEDLFEAEDAMEVPLVNFSPVIAGWLQHPSTMFRNGVGKDIPVVSGTNKNEYNLWIADMKREVSVEGVVKWVGKNGEKLVSALQTENPAATPKLLLSQARTDALFAVPHNRFLDTYKGPSYSYHLEWNGTPPLSASHLLDVPLVFGTYSSPSISPYMGVSPSAMSTLMMSYWGEFVRTHRFGDCPRYTPSTRPSIVFGRGNEAKGFVVEDVRGDVMRAWGVPPPSGAAKL